MLRTFGIVIGSLVVGTWIASRRQQRASSAQIKRLIGAATSPRARPSGMDEIDTLPEPVARYLRRAAPVSRQIGFVRISEIGTLRSNVHSDHWMEFEAEHIVAPAAPGFVWDARVTVASMVRIHVQDAYIDGLGSGRVSLSSFPLLSDAATPEMNSGSLHRFLAEAVWYPTALLPGNQLQWSPISANKALATMTDHGISVSLEFRFADTGEVTGIYTPARWGKFGSSYRQVPWQGHFRNYRERCGILVPTEGYVGWYVDDEWRTVWKGRITGFEVRMASGESDSVPS